MFYLKTKINGKPVEVDIFDDEIHTRCFNCGKEIQVDGELIKAVLDGGDFASTSLSCCGNYRTKLARVK